MLERVKREVCMCGSCVCAGAERVECVETKVLHHKMEGVAKHYEGGVFERGRSSLDLSRYEIYILIPIIKSLMYGIMSSRVTQHRR